MPEFEQATQYARKRLFNDLRLTLTYHSLWHTEHDVVLAADRIAHVEGIGGEDHMLLMTAAWYHDIGFTIQRSDHEAIGADIAREQLPQFGYTTDQIERICGMIMATKLPQSPQNALEEILADADLDSLGRDDFLKTSLLLKAELHVVGVEISYEDWYIRQKNFLSSHEYWRESTKALRNSGKRENIFILESLTSALEAVRQNIKE